MPAKFIKLILSYLIIPIAVVTMTFLGWPCFAKEIWLFDSKGKQVDNYENLIQHASVGDQLCFVGNCEFRFELSQFAWNGSTTKIFMAKRVFADGTYSEPLALRVALKSGATDFSQAGHTTPYVNYISKFMRGHQQVERMGGVDLPPGLLELWRPICGARIYAFPR